MYHLRDEAGGRREAAEREQEHRHQAGQARARLPQAGEVAQLIVRVLGRAEQRHDAERAHVGDRVGQQVEEDGALPRRVGRDDAEQQVAGVRDARIREHALDVVLQHAEHRADDHRRRRRSPPSTGIHCPCIGSSVERNTRDERGERRRLHRRGHEGGHDRRRAFVGVGRPHVERHGRDLEAEADGEQADREQRQRAVRARRDRRRRRRRAASSRRW